MPAYDVAIVGGGPSGLSAALGLARVHRRGLVLTSETQRNRFAPQMHNVLSRDGCDPMEFIKIAEEQIQAYGVIDSVKETVESIAIVKNDGVMGMERSLFQLRASSGRSWTARKVVLATGVFDVRPKIEGYDENWGTNIYNCLFCEGHERSGRPAGILGFHTAYHLSNFFTMLHLGCTPIHIFLDPSSPLLDSDAETALKIAMFKGATVHVERILRLQALDTRIENAGVRVHFQSSNLDPVDLGFLWHPPDMQLAAPHLGEMLALERDTTSQVGLYKRSEPFGETNRTGVFITGDCGTPYMNVPRAMGSGSLVAVGVHFQLLEEEKAALRAEIEAGETLKANL